VIEVLPETGSTNADLASRLSGGDSIAEGHWLVADRQTAGRGRQGREWFDGAGNFMGSTLAYVRPGDPPPATLALVAGLAVHGAVEHVSPGVSDLRLKWPNDLMVGTAKLAGVLLERVGDAIIVGIGLNLTVAPEFPGRETVALARWGHAPDRDAFANVLAERFAEELARWRGYGLPQMLRRWALAAHPPGTPLACHDPFGKRVEGVFAGLADDGGLQLRLADGTTQTIHAGEVHFAVPPQ